MNAQWRSSSGQEAGLNSSLMIIDQSKYPLERINLPEGFKISVYAEVENARSLAKSDNETIFVANRGKDKVYALRDTNNDGLADEKYVIASGLNMPNGVAVKNGDLYVAEVNRILKFSDIESKLDNPGSPEVIYDGYPTDTHHGWKFIAFGPDGKLYVPVGAPCNICKSEDETYASITRMNPDGTDLEVVAHGIRNTVGFTWHPETGNLWFTDNGRDMLGDNIPPCELNKITKTGDHYGYPYCHGGIKDPEFGKGKNCADYIDPEWKFKAHVAPLGLRFYTGSAFPATYKNNLIVAQHGSWNRSSKIGYRLMFIIIENGKATSAEVFADGWLNQDTQSAWGRPVDVLELNDGSMLVSDDEAGLVYRITYEG